MPKVKALAKAHMSAIPDQEVDTPSSHEESTSSDHESESEISFHPSRKHKQPIWKGSKCLCHI